MKKLIMDRASSPRPAFSLPVAMADDYKSDTDTNCRSIAFRGAFVKGLPPSRAKVKAKLAAQAHVHVWTDIKVDNGQFRVWWVLSGKAPTKDASDLAAMLAKDTEGVTSVTNKIVIAE